MTAKKKVPKSSAKARILLVDDHALLRLGLGELINRQTELVVCGEAEDVRAAMQAVATLRPDLVITDLTLRKSDGLELIKNIRARFPELPVLVVTALEESLYGELSLRAGARGYLQKREAIPVVLAAIRRVLAGKLYMSERLSSHMLQQQLSGQSPATVSPTERLTDRERQVLRLLGQWRTTRQIAVDLHLSIKTIEYYRQQLKEKLNLATGTDLIQFAVEWSKNPAQQP